MPAMPPEDPQMKRPENNTKPNDTKVAVGLIGAAIVLVTLVVLGRQYVVECRTAGGDIDQCWDKGLTIAGMGAGGPLSAGVVLGYIVGTANKEKEKAEKYSEGYWTLNPDLRQDEQP
jgi:hypothetical protein